MKKRPGMAHLKKVVLQRQKALTYPSLWSSLDKSKKILTSISFIGKCDRQKIRGELSNRMSISMSFFIISK